MKRESGEGGMVAQTRPGQDRCGNEVARMSFQRPQPQHMLSEPHPATHSQLATPIKYQPTRQSVSISGGVGVNVLPARPSSWRRSYSSASFGIGNLFLVLLWGARRGGGGGGGGRAC